MATPIILGKLQRVPLRDAWRHEEGEFTPWLYSLTQHQTCARIPRRRCMRWNGLKLCDRMEGLRTGVRCGEGPLARGTDMRTLL